jgi:hypothetical protein
MSTGSVPSGAFEGELPVFSLAGKKAFVTGSVLDINGGLSM